MLRLPEDLGTTLRAEARELAPFYALDPNDVDAMTAAVLPSLPQVTVLEVDSFVQWLAHLREHPIVEAHGTEVQELMMRVQSQLLSIFSMQFGSVRTAIAELDSQDLGHESSRRARRLRREEMNEVVQDYLDLAAVIGPSAVIDALISLGLVTEDERESYAGILTQYLGKAPSLGGIMNVLQLHEDFLENPRISTFITHVLEIRIFRQLLTAQVDQRDFRGPEAQVHLDWLTQQLHASLDEIWAQAGVHAASHQSLRERIFHTFIDAATLPIPSCFRTHLTNKRGETCPFPSFTQRVAIERLLRHEQQYICLSPGRGKTAIPIVAYMIRRNRERKPGGYRFLGVYPPNMTREVGNRLVPQDGMRTDIERYFLPGQAPGVGVITSACDDAEYLAALEQPIVLVSDTMLEAERAQQVIIDTLVDQKREEFAYDEFHRSNGGKAWTQNATRLIEVSRYACGTSATPTMGDGLRGVRTACTALARTKTAADRWQNATRVQGNIDTSLAEFRTQLTQILFTPEPPSDWTDRLQQIRWRPNDAELSVLNRIRRDQERNLGQRHADSELCLLAPWLFASGCRNEDPTLLTTLTTDLTELASDDTKHCCAVGTDWLSNGIYVRHPDRRGDSFLERLQAWVHHYNSSAIRPMELYAIHGATSQVQREQIMQAGRTARDRQCFVLLLAQRECVGIGQDMTFVDDLRHIGHPGSLTKLEQFEGRANRAGQNHVPFTVYYAGGTLQAGKRQLAHRRHQQEMAVITPDQPIAEQAFRHVYNPGSSDEAMVQHGPLRGRIEHPEEQHARLQQQLHGRGSRYLERVMKRSTQYDAWALERTQRDALATGDTSRFLALSTLAHARTLAEQNIHGPIVTFGIGGLCLTEDLRRLDPQGQHRLIECAANQRIAELGSHLVPLQHERIVATQHVVQAPQLFQYMQQARKQGNDTQDLHWHTASQVVLTGLENFGWSNDDDIANRSDRTIERGRSLVHVRRLLMPGGILTIHLPAASLAPSEFDRLCAQVLPLLNLEVLQATSGTVESADNMGEPPHRSYTVSARALPDAPDFRPTWKHLRSRIRPDALSFTPLAKQSAEQQRQARTRGRSPERIIHRQFLVNTRNGNTYPTVTYTPLLPHREAQEQLIRALMQATGLIRSMAATPELFVINIEELLPELPRHGIEWDGGTKQPRFILQSHPQDVFRPYDTIWNENEAGE